MYNQCTIDVRLVYALNNIFNKGLLQISLTKVFNASSRKINFRQILCFFLFKAHFDLWRKQARKQAGRNVNNMKLQQWMKTILPAIGRNAWSNCDCRSYGTVDPAYRGQQPRWHENGSDASFFRSLFPISTGDGFETWKFNLMLTVMLRWLTTNWRDLIITDMRTGRPKAEINYKLLDSYLSAM